MANEPLQFTQAIAAIFNVTQAFAGSTELDAVSAGGPTSCRVWAGLCSLLRWACHFIDDYNGYQSF